MIRCEFCDREFSSVGHLFHWTIQFFSIGFILIKYVIWSLIMTRFVLPKTFPCKYCLHKSWVHLLGLSEDSTLMSNQSIDPCKVLLFDVLRHSVPIMQSFCLECLFRYIGSFGQYDCGHSPDHDYAPLSNLDFMELEHDQENKTN